MYITNGLILSIFVFADPPPKRTTKGKEKAVTTSGIARTQGPEYGVKRFLNQEAISRYFDIVGHWALFAIGQ